MAQFWTFGIDPSLTTMKTSFYTYLSSGYGTLWFVLFAFSFVTQSHVSAGKFGYYGFPVIALIYAFYRRAADREKMRKIVQPGLDAGK
jgi:hypothetical protein